MKIFLLTIIFLTGLHFFSQAQVWKLYTSSEGLVNNTVKCLTLDQAGNLCIATNSGFSIFNGSTFTNYNTSNGLPNNWVRSVVCDASGMIWLGTFTGISKFNGSTFTNYNTTNGLPSNNINALSNGTGNILWIGTSSSGLSKYNGSTFTNYNTANGLISNSIKCLCTDLSNNLWVGTSSGISKFDGTTFTNYTTTNGLPSNSINALYCDVSGNLWIGTTGGLVKYDGSIFTIYTTANGLINNSVTAISKDNSGNLWIGYGVIGLSKYNGSSFINFDFFNGFTWGQQTSILCNGNTIYIGNSSGLIETRKWILPIPCYDNLDTNNIRAGFNSNGVIFEKPDGGAQYGTAGFEVPKGTGKTSFFAGNTWLGGFDQNNIFHLAASNFLGISNNFIAGPINLNPLTYEFDSAWNRVWKISKATIDNHILNYSQTGYVVPDAIRNWPAPTADYVDFNNNHIYDPEFGDYPVIRGDQAILTIYNDLSPHNSNGQPMGVEIHALSYSYNSTDSALANSVFTNYKIFNYSSYNYHDLYLGIYSDIDVGDPNDDFMGCDSTINLFYAYNGDVSDIQYGTHIPAQGVVFLSSPISSFGYYTNNSGITGDPTTDTEHYYVLNGQWKDGTPYTYGGNGYGGTVATNFCFSSYPNVPGWSEVTANNVPGDRRGVGTVGPFSFNSGTTICIDVAFINAISYSGNNFTSVNPLLKKRTADLIAFYHAQNWDCGQIFADTNTIAHIYTHDTTICKGAPYYFNNIIVGGTPPYTYNWSPSSGLSNNTVLNPIATPTGTTQYILTATDYLNNIISDTVLLTVFTPPINAGTDTTVCSNETVTLTASPGYLGYDWSCCGNSQSINVNTNHTYSGTVDFSVTVYYQSYSCSNSDTVSVTFLPSPDVQLGNNIVLCKDETHLLNSNTNADHFLWNTGETSASVLLDGTALSLGLHTYFVHAWNDNGCESYDTINITVVSNPVVFAGNDTTVCKNESLFLNATPGFSNYQWSCGGYTSSININTNHNYSGNVDFTVLVHDNNNCTDKDTITVTFLPSPDVQFGNDTLLCNTDVLFLDAGAGADHYIWNTGATTNSVLIDGTSLPLGIYTYNVQAWNNNGCNSYDTISVNVQICSEINKLANDGFKIYPNPSEGTFYIESSQSYFARITNITGDTVFEKRISQGTEKISLKNISKGIYILELVTNQKILKTKLVLK